MDINECDEFTHNCGANTVCANTDGGFTCDCNAGYTPSSANDNSCVDKNECDLGEVTCPINETCLNTSGGAVCVCADDIFYKDSEGNCVDINECPEGGVGCTDVNAVCNNIIGGVDCSTCKSGY